MPVLRQEDRHRAWRCARGDCNVGVSDAVTYALPWLQVQQIAGSNRKRAWLHRLLPPAVLAVPLAALVATLIA